MRPASESKIGVRITLLQIQLHKFMAQEWAGSLPIQGTIATMSATSPQLHRRLSSYRFIMKPICGSERTLFCRPRFTRYPQHRARNMGCSRNNFYLFLPAPGVASSGYCNYARGHFFAAATEPSQLHRILQQCNNTHIVRTVPNTASARCSKADAKRRKATSNIAPISSPRVRLRNS